MPYEEVEISRDVEVVMIPQGVDDDRSRPARRR